MSSVAVGFGAQAGALNAVALGTTSSAAFANSTAIGAGAVTTQANQVAIGTAASTYTLPGITSAASLAAQVGPTSVVTTDAAGNLAATPLSGLATSASVAALGAQVNGLASAVSNLNQVAIDSRNEARRGIAAAAANAPLLMPSAPGRTMVSAKVAGYRGQAGAGFMVAHQLDTASRR